jgi:peptidyl-prolyl cis-trans isomerase SurA
MKRLCALLPRIAFALALCTMIAPPVHAQQGLFDTVARVNDSVVTRFEQIQRARLLQVLRRPDVSEAAALQLLIEDRLKQEAALAAGIVPTQDEIQFGLEDFAARANLTGEELLIAIGEVGIEPETMRDYLSILIAWGEVVRERFTARARPSDDEVDRAMARDTQSGSTRVLLSEILLPLTPDLAATSQERAAAFSEFDDFNAFSAAASRFSIAPSRNEGGRLNWIALALLPEEIARVLLSMQPGDVAGPVAVQGGLALFQLRALEDRRPSLTGPVSIDYAQVRFPPGTDLDAEQARILAQTTRCDDLFGVFRGAGPDRLIRQTSPRSDLPRQISQALDLLDPGETAKIAPQRPGDAGAVVMLCGRADIGEEDLSREDIRRQLFVRRLEGFGESYLAELQADAFIEVVE